MVQFNYTLLYYIMMYIMSMNVYYNLLYLFIIGNNYTSVHPFSNTLSVNKTVIPHIEYGVILH